MKAATLERTTTFETDCRKYMQLHAKQARMKARLDELKERIVPELQTGAKSPRDLPYCLVLRSRLRTLYDWKEALKSQLKLWMGDDAQVNQRIEEIKAGFPQEEGEALYVEINKAFASKLSI